MQEKLRKTEYLREDILRLIEEQEEWKKQQKRIETEENEKIAHHIAEQDARSKQLNEMEYEKRLAIREQQERMCSELDEIERQKLEREELLIDIKCKEFHEKQLALDRKKLEDRIRQRLRTRLELEEQLKDIEMRRLQRKDEEERFRIEQLRLLAEQDRLEILTKEKQRIKKQEHHRLVREMLIAREDARNAEIFDIERENNELIALEKRRLVFNR